MYATTTGGDCTHVLHKENIDAFDVFAALKLYRESGSCENLIRKPRVRKTTAMEDRVIVNFCKKKQFLTSTEVLNHVQPQIHKQITSCTVRRRLLESGLRGCVALRKPLVSKTNLQKRFNFAREHVNKPLSYCKKSSGATNPNSICLDQTGKSMYVAQKTKRITRTTQSRR